MKFIALTGGIGCGKSTVSSILSQKYGWKIIDADQICHDLYRYPPKILHETLQNRWGNRIFDNDGRILRTEIAKIVFMDADELNFLNRVFHPLILKEVLRMKNEFFENQKADSVILDAPLFFECSWDISVDCVLVVWSCCKVQHNRLISRGLNENEIKLRISSQFSADEKMRRADYALVNNGTREWLEYQIDSFVMDIKTKKL